MAPRTFRCLALGAAFMSLACVDLARPRVMSGLPDGGRSDLGGPPTDFGPPPADLGEPLDGEPEPDTGLPADTSDEPSRDGGEPVPHDAAPGEVVDLGPGPPDLPAPPDRPAPPDAGADIPMKAANGTACSSAATCQSGLCVDQTCCESVCNSGCYSCRIPGQLGLCRPIPAGSDPDNDCAESAFGSCANDGTCNGLGTCRLRVNGSICVAGTCSGSTETAASTCDGRGQCLAGLVRECAPYLCSTSSCRTNCTTAADCKAGFGCSGGSCVVAAPVDAGAPDMAPAGQVLVVDDFNDGTLGRNTMGGSVTWDNQNVALVSGQVRFSWNGGSIFQDFIETFLPNFCGYDLRQYRTLRFRMRASSGTKSVRIFFPYATPTKACETASTPLIRTVSVTTTMNTFDVDLSGVTRDKALFVEFAPNSTDSTEYFLDDIHLLP